jgi:hypothetical protein
MVVGNDGKYLFEGIGFQTGLTLKVVPDDVVVDMGTESGYLEWSYQFDHSGSTEKDVMLQYYSYVTDDIHGIVTYDGGPMDGMNATNATVYLLNETMIEIANYTVNETGMYLFEDVEFGFNYTIRVIPENHVMVNGEVSGYLVYVSKPFNHTGLLEMNIEVDHYTYVPPAPTSGPISGRITYLNGDKDGQAASGATVSIYSTTEGYTNTTTNATGHYMVEDMPFGPYTITVFPAAADEGELNVKSGYLAEEFDQFTLSSGDGIVKDYELTYYEYTPSTTHPSVVIKDKDGNPIQGVIVTVTVGENVYTATTGADGKATFTDLDGDSFPTGAKFKAEKAGYETIDWEGSTIPSMKEIEEDDDEEESNLILYLVIAVVIIVILVVLFVLLRRKSAGEEYEE